MAISLNVVGSSSAAVAVSSPTPSRNSASPTSESSSSSWTHLEHQPSSSSQALTVPARPVKELWYTDGNLVLEAEGRHFKIFGGLLAARSSVFADMLAFPPPPEGNPTIDGCTVVHVYDSAPDLAYFLRAVFDSSFFEPPPTPTTLPTLSAILRLALKYDVPFLAKRALAHLATTFPSTLADWKARDARRTIPPLDNTPFAALRLARECNADWLIPSIAYCVCSHPFAKTLDGAVVTWAERTYVHDGEEEEGEEDGAESSSASSSSGSSSSSQSETSSSSTTSDSDSDSHSDTDDSSASSSSSASHTFASSLFTGPRKQTIRLPWADKRALIVGRQRLLAMQSRTALAILKCGAPPVPDSYYASIGASTPGEGSIAGTPVGTPLATPPIPGQVPITFHNNVANNNVVPVPGPIPLPTNTLGANALPVVPALLGPAPAAPVAAGVAPGGVGAAGGPVNIPITVNGGNGGNGNGGNAGNGNAGNGNAGNANTNIPVLAPPQFALNPAAPHPPVPMAPFPNVNVNANGNGGGNGNDLTNGNGAFTVQINGGAHPTPPPLIHANSYTSIASTSSSSSSSLSSSSSSPLPSLDTLLLTHCPRPTTCALTRLRCADTLVHWDMAGLLDYFEDNAEVYAAGFCKACRERFEDVCGEEARAMWEGLPGAFGLDVLDGERGGEQGDGAGGNGGNGGDGQQQQQQQQGDDGMEGVPEGWRAVERERRRAMAD